MITACGGDHADDTECEIAMSVISNTRARPRWAVAAIALAATGVCTAYASPTSVRAAASSGASALVIQVSGALAGLHVAGLQSRIAVREAKASAIAAAWCAVPLVWMHDNAASLRVLKDSATR